MKRLLIPCLVASGLLVSCVTSVTEATLKNDKGDTRYCYLSNDHTLVSMGAMSEYNRCLNDAGTAGFRKVSEK
jgi:hypothetical protein